jgi:hypothetical protein
MKRITFISFALIVLGASIILPFKVDLITRDLLTVGMNILTAVCSFLTLIVALLLFNKFGIERTLLERQTNAVICFLEALKKIQLHVHDGRQHIYFTVERRNARLFEDIGDRIVVFHSSTSKELEEAQKASENIFMPREISGRFSPLVPVMFSGVRSDESESQHYFKVEGPHRSDDSKDDWYGHAYDNKTTIAEYIGLWNNVVDAVNKWLQRNSSLHVHLNI